MATSDTYVRNDPGANAEPTIDSPATKSNEVTNSLVDNAAAVANTIKEHPMTQSVTNGPVAQSVRAGATQTSNEFGGLANSRQVPSHKAATGQTLTHYHSFFYTLLSWAHPRATGVTFAASVLFIFACRYLPVLRWLLRMIWMTLGVVTLSEGVATLALGTSLTASIRPRQYYKIPKESLEASLDDLEQLINFFVIEVQRVVFAENIAVTAVAFTTAFASYFLIKILPLWGLLLLGDIVLFVAPLIYIQNKEVIDEQLSNASHVIAQQTAQVRDVTAQHTSKGFESLKAYTNDATAKATDLVGTARQKLPLPGSSEPKATLNQKPKFPDVPTTDFPSAAEHTKPVIQAPTHDGPIAASSS